MPINLSPGNCCKQRGPIIISGVTQLGDFVWDLSQYATMEVHEGHCSTSIPRNILCARDTYWAIVDLWNPPGSPRSYLPSTGAVRGLADNAGKNMYGNIVNGTLIGLPDSLRVNHYYAGTVYLNHGTSLQTGHRSDNNTILWTGHRTLWVPGVNEWYQDEYGFQHERIIEEERPLTLADFEALEGGSNAEPVFESRSGVFADNGIYDQNQCMYATPTSRKWGGSCFVCTVTECRSPTLPPSTDTVAAHIRLPQNNDTQDGYYEVRSKYCNKQCCSLYRDKKE